jgi:hypothetical protein
VTKLLKICAVLLLVLGIAALTLGWMLFNKREMLKGRAQRLENAVIALSRVIEAAPATVDVPSQYPEKDISAVTSDLIDTPEQSDFWSNYKHALELPDQPTMDLGRRRQELMLYYKLDLATGRPERDIQGNKITSGPGTMQGVLDELLDKATDQLTRLNDTRNQLEDVRKELVKSIGEINELKTQCREALKTIVDRDAEIARLKDEIATLNQTIAQLEEEKQDLQDQIADQQRTITQLEEEKAQDKLRIEDLEASLEACEKVRDARPPTAGDLPPGMAQPRAIPIEPGVKGAVEAVSPKWNFVIVKLDDAFMQELLQDEKAGIPKLELNIRRPGKEQTFVAKVKLIQVHKADKLGVCDVLPAWKQAPISSGDVVFY